MLNGYVSLMLKLSVAPLCGSYVQIKSDGTFSLILSAQKVESLELCMCIAVEPCSKRMSNQACMVEPICDTLHILV